MHIMEVSTLFNRYHSYTSIPQPTNKHKYLKKKIQKQKLFIERPRSKKEYLEYNSFWGSFYHNLQHGPLQPLPFGNSKQQ